MNQPVNTVSSTDVLCVGSDFILRNITYLSKLHTDCMFEDPWHEVWSNDLGGGNPRIYSPAMWRHLVNHKARFYVVLDSDFDPSDLHFEASDENFKGIGVLLPMDSLYIETMEWTNHLSRQGFEIKPGDLSIDLFLVNPKYRGQGVMRSLGSKINQDLLSHTSRYDLILWMQTRVESVRKFAYELGFNLSSTVNIKGTKRDLFSKILFSE